ncbi:MAG: hypothetical protein DHS20C16_06500 [Phycisphaerae bacterium]|nr:MAG: hypothetical protein DHS20C16_06500 [Phycisphaerae bacterium]
MTHRMLKTLMIGFVALAAGCDIIPDNGDNGNDNGNNGNGNNDELAKSFVADLSGAAERPDPVQTNATGTATFELNDAGTQLTYNITAEGLSGDVSGAHFHLSDNGPEGSGGVVFGFTEVVVNDGNGGATAQGTWDLSADDVADIRAGDIYVNLHTDANPAGEIRGNLVEAS